MNDGSDDFFAMRFPSGSLECGELTLGSAWCRECWFAEDACWQVGQLLKGVRVFLESQLSGDLVQLVHSYFPDVMTRLIRHMMWLTLESGLELCVVDRDLYCGERRERLSELLAFWTAGRAVLCEEERVCWHGVLRQWYDLELRSAGSQDDCPSELWVSMMQAWVRLLRLLR